MSAITITRNDHDAAGFRRAAAASRDADAARRMLALALVLDGASRADAARACGMDRQTLRDWVHRYNDEGWQGCRTGAARSARGLACRPSRRRSSPSWFGPVPTRPCTAWCAGDGPILPR